MWPFNKKAVATDEMELLKKQVETMQLTIDYLNSAHAVKDALMTLNYNDYEHIKGELMNLITAIVAMHGADIVINSVFFDLIKDPKFGKRVSTSVGENQSVVLKLIDLEPELQPL